MPVHGRSEMQHFPSLTEEHVLSRTYTNAGKSAFWDIWGNHVASLILAIWLDGGHNGEIISLHLQNQPGGAAAHHHLGMRCQCRALIQLTISKGLKFKKYLNCLWLFNLGTEQPSGRLCSDCQNVCSSSLSTPGVRKLDQIHMNQWSWNSLSPILPSMKKCDVKDIQDAAKMITYRI